MKTWKYIMLAATIPFVCACSNDSEGNEAVDNNVIRLEAVHPSQTRVTDTNFEMGDQIGVYMTLASNHLQLGGNELNNEPFTFDGKLWTPKSGAYWNKGKHSIYAYYPYAKDINGIEDYHFTVAADQNAADNGNGLSGYEASDFLWASATQVEASANPVKLKFNHCMSKLLIKLEKSETFDGEIPDDVEVFIHNTVRVASLDLSTGGVSKDDYAGPSSIKARKLGTTLFTACVVPQNIQSRRPLIEIITQGVSYLLEGKISFKQGVQHTITVTLTKNPDQTKIEIGGGIENWQ